MLPPLETVLCHYTRTQGKLAQQLHVPRLVYMSSILKDDPAHQWKNASFVIKSRRRSTTSSSHARSLGKFGGIFSPRSAQTTHRSEGTPSYLGGALGGNDGVETRGRVPTRSSRSWLGSFGRSATLGASEANRRTLCIS